MAGRDLASRLRGFRPGRAATLIALPGVVLLLGLGVWQVARYVEKAAINDYRAQRAAEPPMVLPAMLADPERFEFRRVVVRGTFLHERELHLNARSRRGNNGYQIITPLVREAGPPVLVRRGRARRARSRARSRSKGTCAATRAAAG